MKKLLLFVLSVFIISTVLAIDRSGNKTLWDLDIKGFYLEKWDKNQVDSAIMYGFNTLVIRDASTISSPPLDLNIYELTCDVSKTSTDNCIINISNILSGEPLQTAKRVKLLTDILSTKPKDRPIFFKIPLIKDEDQFFLLTGLSHELFASKIFFITSKRFDYIPADKFIVWTEGCKGLEDKVLSSFENGMAGFIISDFDKVTEEQLLLLSKIILPQKKIKTNLPDYLDVPQYFQKTSYYCGPASVQMLLDFLMNRKIEQDTLAKWMETKGPTAGTRPVLIMKFLRKFTGEPFREVEAFSHEIIEKNIEYGFPVIARVETSYLRGWDDDSGGGHFILIKGFTKNFYYVNDAVKGKVFYSRKEIEEATVKHVFGPLLIVRVK